MIPMLLWPGVTLQILAAAAVAVGLYLLLRVGETLEDVYWYFRRRRDLGLTHEQFKDWCAVERAYGAQTDDELEALFAEWKALR